MQTFANLNMQYAKKIKFDFYCNVIIFNFFYAKKIKYDYIAIKIVKKTWPKYVT